MNFSFDYSSKRVLVTGGVSGIGRAISLAYLAAGAEVIACGVTEQELAAARADPAFARIAVVALDVTDKQAVDAVVGGQESLDVVVTSAGIIRRDSEHDPEVFDQVINVNLSGSMRVASAARPLLARTRGSVVLIGSVMSFFGGPRQPAYSASKGAIRNLTMSLACAYAADDIRVNAVAPGWVITDLSKGARENPGRNAMILARTPMGRWAQPAEIADPVLFLSSDAARFMTGTMMLVDGGFTSVG